MSSSSQSHLVSFPTSELVPVSPLPVPHLPFRRISLPTSPSPALAAQRQSVASFASLDSLAEESAAVHQHRRAKRRSLNPTTRSHRRAQADDDRHAKRSKIIFEFYATEKSYLDGLDLVYTHFLTPILRSLDTSKPLLTRNEITTLFSNFIDIWNFHHTFFTALSRRVQPSTPMSNHNTPISSLLLAHFPYLSLYAPFITAFPSTLAFLTSLAQSSTPNPAFSAFLRAQESHPVCAHLRLADYLLTLVQRCPRYLLLLKDLLDSTDPDDPEREKLQEARALVEKITIFLNTSLAAHAQTLALISLQRNTRDLPSVFNPLVAPGRKLIKRGTLMRSGGEGAGRKSFEFLLLSDYLLWLEREEAGMGVLVPDGGGQSPRKRRALINVLGGNDEEKWWCRGYMSLVDMEVVLVVDRPSGVGSGGGGGGGARIEVLSPEGSFALYHASGSSQSAAGESNSLSSWVDSIRTARAARLEALALSNPDSTLSASTSGIHLRRALRAFASESDDIDYEPKFEEIHGNVASLENPQAGSSSMVMARPRLRRAQLDNFLPPVWIPDAKTDTCMRCGRPFGFVLDLRLGDVFGWGFGKGSTGGAEDKRNSETGRSANEGYQVEKRQGGGAWRRKHHCRLCGRVVCAACSGKTFYITQDDSDSSLARKRQKQKPARACGECFEAAFPFVLPSLRLDPFSSGQAPSDRPSTPPSQADHGIQPWLSIPSRQAISKDVGEALMAMDLSPTGGALSRSPSRTALSTSPSRARLSSNPSRKSHLSTSPTKASSPLREQHALVHGDSGSTTSSPSRRITHLPHISSGESDHKQPSPLRADDALSGGANRDPRQEDHGYVPTRPIRVRSPTARPRSYHDILEDFTQHERGLSIPSSISSAPGLGSVREGNDEAEREDGEGEGGSGIEIRRRNRSGATLSDDYDLSSEYAGPTQLGPLEDGAAPREDTARRQKRFSMAAVALQTAPVFARARQDTETSSVETRRFALTYGAERDKTKKERQGEREGSAVGLLMEVLRGKVRYPGRNP